MDEKNLPSVDPSFLHRFEKQTMSINDILNDRQELLVENLRDWVERMSSLIGVNQIAPLHDKFTQKDLFIGFDKDETLQSLVFNITKSNPKADDEKILETCKEKLIALISPDWIVRAEHSILDQDEMIRLKYTYFHRHHHSLYDYFNALINQEKSLDNEGYLIIINTFSNINANIKYCLQDLLKCQVYNLSTFRTEAQLSSRVKNFFFESADQVLIFQCDVTAIDTRCIRLTKHIIEQFKNEYLIKKENFETNMLTKYACIIYHIQQGYESNLISPNFICDWKQVTIKSLEPQKISLTNLLDKSLNSKLFDKMVNSTISFEKILKDELLWCLSCIKYSNESYRDHIRYDNFIQK